MPNITISTAVVPAGTCPTWIIALWPQLAALLSANLNGSLNVFNFGSSTPAPADQDKPWVRLDAAGRIDKFYNYSGGAWIAKHPVVAGLIQLWEGDISTIDTFDGGEVAAVTATTGPMWERVTALQAKFPIGVGTLPTTATILAVGSTGGEELHSLTVAEMPPHTHDVRTKVADTGGGSGVDRLRRVADAEVLPFDARTESTGGTGSPAATQGHNTLPPYYALHFIRKSARTHYRI